MAPPTARRLKSFLPDVPRLLRLRDHFQQLQSDDDRSSVTAFLAWKAFLVVALQELERGEKARCRASAAATMARFPAELSESVGRFSRIVHVFLDPRAVSDALFEEWFITADEFRELERNEIRGRAAQHRIALRQLVAQPALDSAPPALSAYGDRLGSALYAIRNAVLAHASIHTTSTLFKLVVPPFEDVVAELALLGWARHAEASPAAARYELAQLDR